MRLKATLGPGVGLRKQMSEFCLISQLTIDFPFLKVRIP